MNGCGIELAGARLTALGSGALWWAAERLLCVSDLHLGKAERMARRSGAMLPPYETRDTLARLEREIEACAPETVVCLGDSFDDDRAGAALEDGALDWIARLQAGRRWIWITGNHDPGPVRLGGTGLAELRQGRLVFRHVAAPGEEGEISGHYHPKAELVARGRKVSRPCFLHDRARAICPAFGTYTGGLRWSDPAFAPLFPEGGHAILTGRTPRPVPMPRREPAP